MKARDTLQKCPSDQVPWDPDDCAHNLVTTRVRILGAWDKKFSWKSVLRQDPCVWCGRRIPGSMTIDHIQPVFRGGPRRHTVANSASACLDCNQKRKSFSVLGNLILRKAKRVRGRRRKRKKKRQTRRAVLRFRLEEILQGA